LWTVKTIEGAGALGVEVTISGKLRSERAHFEKHSSGIIPKSGNMADKVVREGITHVLTKMGIMGIRLKIAIKNATPQEFELITNFKDHNNQINQADDKNMSDSNGSNIHGPNETKPQKEIIENKGEITK
jgi:small subunit ribosomal protein S3